MVVLFLKFRNNMKESAVFKTDHVMIVQSIASSVSKLRQCFRFMNQVKHCCSNKKAGLIDVIIQKFDDAAFQDFKRPTNTKIEEDKITKPWLLRNDAKYAYNLSSAGAEMNAASLPNDARQPLSLVDSCAAGQLSIADE